MTNTPNNFKESFSGGLPREEFEKSGGNAAALTSEKLLAILLKTGAPGCNVMELSHRLVSAFGGTGHLVRANFIQLKEQIGRYNKLHPDKRIVGIGKVKLMELAAAFELVRREYAVKEDDVRKVDVVTSESRYQVFRRVLNPDDRQENFAVLLVDNKLHPLTDPLVITRGTMNGTMVHPREVFSGSRPLGSACRDGRSQPSIGRSRAGRQGHRADETAYRGFQGDGDPALRSHRPWCGRFGRGQGLCLVPRQAAR